MYHAVHICQEIANRLKSPKDLLLKMQMDSSQSTSDVLARKDLTLASGLSGIACFYSSMDAAFPDEGWDRIAHDFLKVIVEELQFSGASDCSLFSGITGLCFALFLCSKEDKRYQHVLKKLEEAIFSSVRNNTFPRITSKLSNNEAIDPKDYDLANGLCGVVAYLLLRKNVSHMQGLLEDCLMILCKLINRELVHEKALIPGWYISPEHQSTYYQTKYVQGSFILSTPFGATGVLSILALAQIDGYITPQTTEAIQRLSQWLIRNKGELSTHDYWPYAISLEEELEGKPLLPDLVRDTWFYGVPAICRSLYLAAVAIRDEPLLSFSIKHFEGLFSKNPKEWNLVGPSFSSGRAGLLAMTHQMAVDTKSPILLDHALKLEEDLKGFFKPQSLYGFQAADINDPDNYRWIDEPGIFDGASGIALSLLAIHKSSSNAWQRAFLIA